MPSHLLRAFFLLSHGMRGQMRSKFTVLQQHQSYPSRHRPHDLTTPLMIPSLDIVAMAIKREHEF